MEDVFAEYIMHSQRVLQIFEAEQLVKTKVLVPAPNDTFSRDISRKKITQQVYKNILDIISTLYIPARTWKKVDFVYENLTHVISKICTVVLKSWIV